MIRVLHRLTPSVVKTAGAGLHSDGGNLYLQCTEGADGGIRRSWIFRYTKGGKEHAMGLGAVITISLSEARQEATELRKLLYHGKDPLQLRKTERASEALEAVRSVCFDDVATMYIKAHSQGWSSDVHTRQWERSIKDHCSPTLGKLPVASVDTPLVMAVLEPLWRSNPVTGSRVRERVEAILGFATTRGYRSGPNPAAWKNHLENLLPALSRVHQVRHHPALPYKSIPQLMLELHQNTAIPALALQLLTLTASRTGEVLGAKWDQIDLDAAIWTRPPELMKGRRQHRVPLSGGAIAILQKAQAVQRNEWIFPGDRRQGGLSDKVLATLLSRTCANGHSVHGLRASFKTWCREQTATSEDLVERCLAHQVGNAASRAYLDGDLIEQRRPIMDAWSAFCG